MVVLLVMSEVDNFSKQLDIGSPGCDQVELSNILDELSIVGLAKKNSLT